MTLWLAVAAWTGCADSHPPVEGEPAFFEPDRVLQVDIQMAEEDWNALRTQTRDLFDLIEGEDCLDAPFESPFTYFPATVTVDGERVERVGVRKKGFIGSLDEQKPSLKIKFDAFVEGQQLRGTERITLNNARQDPAYVNQCLAYAVFDRGGVPAPRCAFARVTVNGVDLGLYVHVENVKKRFLRRQFGDDEGGLFEGTLSDFRTGWLGTFEQKTDREEPADRSRLEALRDAIERGAPVEELDELVDLAEFVDQWVLEVLVGHWDGYAGNTNNFYVYDHPADRRLRFVPWGVDATFGQGGPRPGDPVPPTFVTGALARHLWSLPEGRALYEEALDRHLASTWDETWLLGGIDRMEALLRPFLQPRDARRGFDRALRARRDFVARRREEILAAQEAPFEPEPLRERVCLVPKGTVSATFDTVFGTPIDESLDREGRIDLEMDGAPVRFVAQGSTANPDDGSPDKSVVAVVGLRADRVAVVVATILPDRLLRSGIERPFGLLEHGPIGLVLEFDTTDPMAEPQVVGMLMRGRIGFEEASPVEGAQVAGQLQARVYEPIF